MRFLGFPAFLLTYTLSLVKAQDQITEFDPYSYQKQSITCPATNRATDEKVDISLSFVDINPTAKTTLVLVHGWPSLWSSWYRQIEALKDDYHLVIPELRGFGDSEHPPDTRSSGTFGDHISDLECILAGLGVNSAICIGHDWGSQICYEAARSRPDLFKGVAGLTIPYIPSVGPFLAAENLPKMSPGLAYQVYFNGLTDQAVEELDKDIRRTLRSTLGLKGRKMPPGFLQDTESYLGPWGNEEIPPIGFLTPKHEDYFVESYSKRGFRPTLGFYTDENRGANWDFTQSQGNHTITNPVLTILPLSDNAGNWPRIMKMLGSERFCSDFQSETVDAAHWLPQDAYERVNQILKEWLADKFGDAGSEQGTPESDPRDEL